MSQQLVKKGANGRYSNVMPKSWIEAIKDKNTGKTLVEILQSFNMYFLPYDGNSTSTRCLVPTMFRKKGLWITYVKYDGNVYTEWYAADEIDDKSWGDSSNWRIGNNTLVGDITISANGNWVINGTETEFKAVGENGNTPLIRFSANNKFQVSYNNGEKWLDISDSITNNLRIKKYIGINESLPTSGIEEGTIYMKGPYYAEDDTLNDNPIYRMWIYAWKGNTLAWQDNGEFTSIAAGVVQETGNSETEVMSQKAVSEKLSKLESEVFLCEKHNILGTDTGSPGYSWGFRLAKPCTILRYKPDFVQPSDYTIDVYDVKGEIGSKDTTYNLRYSNSYKKNEICEIHDINTNTIVIVTSSAGTIIKYSEIEPSIIANLIYRKEGQFNKVDNAYASGYFETIQSNIENIENRIKIIEDNTDSLSSLYNKKIYLIGDSITEENNGRAETNWVGFLRERCGCIIINQGKSGTGFSTYPRQKYINRIPSSTTEVDIFGITISFNDLDMTLEGIDEPSQRREIGTYEDTTETTICGFINVFFDTLLERFPTTPVITYIQNPWAEGGSRPHHPAYRYGEALSDEFVTKVKETIQRRGVPVYDDLYTNGSVLKPWIEGNRNVYFIGPTGSVDTDHPGTEGHKVIYKYLRKRFEENIIT